jgi:hypothetical protein
LVEAGECGEGNAGHYQLETGVGFHNRDATLRQPTLSGCEGGKILNKFQPPGRNTTTLIGDRQKFAESC